MSNGKTDARLEWLSDAILIAAGSGFAYFLAFVYEREYCKYFNIPDAIIRPGFVTVLSFAAAVYAFGISIIWIVNSLYVFFISRRRKNPSAVRRFIQVRGPAMLFVVILASAYGWNRNGWLTLLIACAYLFIVDVLPAILSRHEYGSFTLAFRASMENAAQPSTLWDPIHRRFGSQTVLVLVFCWSAIIFAGALGRTNAGHQTRFLVPDTRSDSVVVRIYGSDIICVSVDRANKRIGEELTVMDLQGPGSVRLRWENIGPFTGKLPPSKKAQSGKSRLKSWLGKRVSGD
ncbi:MAG TPA: hypothetical protein PK213_02775 [Deltaproteobacteria bacterium]|nr:hypothetical protein [Deltaproteobacteria bacterium]